MEERLWGGDEGETKSTPLTEEPPSLRDCTMHKYETNTNIFRYKYRSRRFQNMFLLPFVASKFVTIYLVIFLWQNNWRIVLWLAAPTSAHSSTPTLHHSLPPPSFMPQSPPPHLFHYYILPPTVSTISNVNLLPFNSLPLYEPCYQDFSDRVLFIRKSSFTTISLLRLQKKFLSKYQFSNWQIMIWNCLHDSWPLTLWLLPPWTVDLWWSCARRKWWSWIFFYQVFFQYS